MLRVRRLRLVNRLLYRRLLRLIRLMLRVGRLRLVNRLLYGACSG
jgi:hypothetical protein